MKTPLLPKICVATGILVIVASLGFFLLTIMLHVTDSKAGRKAYEDTKWTVFTSGKSETIVLPRQTLDALLDYVFWREVWITAGCNLVIFLGVLLIVSGAVGMKRQDITIRASQQVPASRPPVAPL